MKKYILSLEEFILENKKNSILFKLDGLNVYNYYNSKHKILVAIKTNLISDMREYYDYQIKGDEIFFFDDDHHFATLFKEDRFFVLKHDGSLNKYGRRDVNKSKTNESILNEKEKPWNEEISSEIRLMKKLDSKEDGIPNQRKLMRRSFSHNDESKMSDREVSKFLSDFVIKVRDEKKQKKLYDLVDKKLLKLLKSDNFYISVMGDRVHEDSYIKFTWPLLLNGDKRSIDEVSKFISNAKEIEVNVTNRFAKKWDVFYSGTISNGKDKIEFEDVDNGFAVNLN